MKGVDVSAPWLSDLTALGLGLSRGSNRKRCSRMHRSLFHLLLVTCFSDGFLLDFVRVGGLNFSCSSGSQM